MITLLLLLGAAPADADEDPLPGFRSESCAPQRELCDADEARYDAEADALAGGTGTFFGWDFGLGGVELCDYLYDDAWCAVPGYLECMEREFARYRLCMLDANATLASDPAAADPSGCALALESALVGECGRGEDAMPPPGGTGDPNTTVGSTEAGSSTTEAAIGAAEGTEGADSATPGAAASSDDDGPSRVALLVAVMLLLAALGAGGWWAIQGFPDWLRRKAWEGDAARARRSTGPPPPDHRTKTYRVGARPGEEGTALTFTTTVEQIPPPPPPPAFRLVGAEQWGYKRVEGRTDDGTVVLLEHGTEVEVVERKGSKAKVRPTSTSTKPLWVERTDLQMIPKDAAPPPPPDA
jgi:hypothetical protein